MTQAQTDRTEARDLDTGKFVKNPCECCGKPAPMTSYHSWSGCNANGGIGLVLRAGCAVKLEAMTEADALAVLAARAAVVAAQPAKVAPVKKMNRWERIAAKRAAAKLAGG